MLSHSVSANEVGTTINTTTYDPQGLASITTSVNTQQGDTDFKASQHGSPEQAKPRVTSMASPIGGEAGKTTRGLVAEQTFLDSLNLDRDQLSDFSNSEGHFLYLRQKPGTDATAYNLEVSCFRGSQRWRLSGGNERI